MARCFGLEVQVLTPAEAQERWPLLRTEDLVGAVYLPKDGQTNPIDTTQALAARRAQGRRRDRRELAGHAPSAPPRVASRASAPRRGDIARGGRRQLRRDVGARARRHGRSVSVPLHAAEHFYIVTEPMAGPHRRLPMLRDADGCSYFKEDAGKLLVGWFEPEAKPWGMDGIPDDFAFEQLPEDLEHIEPLMAAAMRRVPALESAPACRCSSTAPRASRPTTATCSARRPRCADFFVAAGFNSIGIQSAGGRGQGAGRLDRGRRTRRWTSGTSTSAAARRSSATAATCATAPSRSLGLLYAMHWPFRQAGDRARRAQVRAARPPGARAAPASARSRAGSAPTGSRPPA